tara:strand:+ start:924655 stop:929190 length:4536 start_codon:yes stop_codon:yes gene_type:complete
MPPVDAFSGTTGNFVSESTFPLSQQSFFAGSESGYLGSEADHVVDTSAGSTLGGLTPGGSKSGDSIPGHSTPGDFFGGPPSSGPMEFRVIRSGLPVRRLRLTGNRYTFGSADGCSIQLNDPALRPMHAVLIRDASRILVRAYSVPIELNDTRTTEANLQCGDVVRIGAYSFELLSTAASQFDHPARPASAASNALSAPMTEDPMAWREQLRREVAQWRARQAECDRRENRCADRESVLRNRESELWTRAEQLHRRESHLMAQESAAIQIQEDYANKQRELTQLRDENRAKQQAFDERETEFRSLEREYREHVEEASRQLQQSQQQAEAATQAVQRMRDQFEDLNKQLADLQHQQDDLQQREQRQSDEHQQLRRQLESARDEAIDGKAKSEAHRYEIEARIEELDAQLRQSQAECEAERKRADESEVVAEQLREQVQQLHENIRQASEEASQLREDYEQACDSVRSLEAIIEQGNSRGEMDRESWFGEAEELRQSVEQLSIDLAQAHGELSDLRQANEKLTQQLDGLTNERDEAISELESRPTQDAFQLLRVELTDANEKLARMQNEYTETLERLDRSQKDLESSRKQLDSSVQELESTQDELESSKQDLQSSQQDLESFRQELEASKQKCESSAQELELIQQELESAQHELESARQEKDAAQQWAADAEAKLEETNTPAEDDSKDSAGLFGAAGALAAGAAAWGLSDADSASDDSPIVGHADVDAAHADVEDTDAADTDAADADFTDRLQAEDTESVTESADADYFTDAESEGADFAADDSDSVDALSTASEANVDDGNEDASQGWPAYSSSTEDHLAESQWNVEDQEVVESSASSDFDSQLDPESETNLDDSTNADTGSEQVADNHASLHWSPEPSQKADPPHFETAEPEAWDAPSASEAVGDYEAEFDRVGDSAADQNEAGAEAGDDAWSRANESVDNAIDLIEKNVDEAIAVDVHDQSPAVDDEPAAEELEEPGLEDSVAESSEQAADDVWSKTDSSPWGHRTAGTEQSTSDTYSDEADVTSPWNSADAFTTDAESPTADDDSSLVNQWRPFQDEAGSEAEDADEVSLESDRSGNQDADSESALDDAAPKSESIGLADQLINDLNASSESDSEIDPVEESMDPHTSLWEQTHPFSHEDVTDGNRDAPGPEDGAHAEGQSGVGQDGVGQDGAGQYGWDQEYPEESRSSQWTNDVEGDHTELIQDSSVESALQGQFGSSFGQDADVHDEHESEASSSGIVDEDDSMVEPSAFQPEMEDEDDSHDSVALLNSGSLISGGQFAEETSFDESIAAESYGEESRDEEPAEEPQAADAPVDEDDSIEAYMNRLLNRVQGTSGGDTSTTQTTPLVASEKSGDEEGADTTSATTDPGASLQPIEPDAPLVPRSQAPERNSDLSAMRELANSSARSAVARSVRIQARDTQIKAFMKFAQAAVAGGCAFACFTFLDWSVAVKLVMVLAIVVIAGILVQEGLVLLKEAKRRLNVAEKGDDEEVAAVVGKADVDAADDGTA